MKTKYFLLLFILSLFHPAVAGIHIEFKEKSVKQGSLQAAKIIIDTDTAKTIKLQNLQGESLEKIVHIQSVDSVIENKNNSSWSSDAIVIFLKVPVQRSLTYKHQGREIPVSWNDIEVKETEAPKEFLFGTFEVPSKLKFFLWILIPLLSVILIAFIIDFRKKWKVKKEIRLYRKKIRDELLAASQFQDVVMIWQKKRELIKEFPHLEDPFKELEKVLFRYQFQHHQSESEKAEVLKSYRSFLDRIQGGLDGI